MIDLLKGNDAQSEIIAQSLSKLFDKTMLCYEQGQITKDTFQKLATLRHNFTDALSIEQQRGAQYLLNTKIKLGHFDLPEAYRSFQKEFPIRLLWSMCKNAEEFEKYVHILAVSLANAETNYQKVSKQKEIWPEFGKRLLSNEAGYKNQIYQKCRAIAVLSKRYPLTHIEADQAVLTALADQKKVSGDEQKIRKEIKARPAEKLSAPAKRHTQLAKRELFPIQQKAFDGDGVHKGILQQELEHYTEGKLAKTYAVVLPTGAGKTIVAAEIAARHYQRAIEQAMKNQCDGLDIEDAPAVLFVAPQKVLAAQGAKELHNYLAGQYDIKVRSLIGMDGKIQETNWAFLEESMRDYKEAVLNIDESSMHIRNNSSLEKIPLSEIKDMLLSQWEDVLQLSKYDGDRDNVEITELAEFAHDNEIVNIGEIKNDFQQAVERRFESIRDGVARGKKAEKQRSRAVKSLLDKRHGHTDSEETAIDLAEQLLRREWDAILSPFAIDNEDVNTLRQITILLKIPIPKIYRGLFKLTVDCQNGMIAKPDPKDYLNEHLESAEQIMRASMPMEAAFCTVQGLQPKEGSFSKLESLIQRLSNNGERKIIVFLDEAHHYSKSASQNLAVLDYLKSHPNVERIIGMTASDVRASGERINLEFGDTVAKATLLEAVASGRLQQFTFVQPQIDTGGFNIDQVAEISGKKAEKSKERLLASISDLVHRVELIEAVKQGLVEINTVFPGLPVADQVAWVEGLKTQWSRNILGFCNDIASAKFIANELNSRGFRSATILSDTTATDRARIINEYKTGAIQAILLVGVGREGLDLPQTTIGAIFGSVGSPVTLQQMFGRFLRRRPGPPTQILDYSVPASQIYHAELLRKQFAVDVVGSQITDNVRKAGVKIADQENITGGKAMQGEELLATLSQFEETPINFSSQTIHTMAAMQLVQVQAETEAMARMTDLHEEQAAQEIGLEKKGERDQSLTPVDIQFIYPENMDSLVQTLVRNKILSVEIKTTGLESSRLGFIEFSLNENREIVAQLRNFQAAPGFSMAKAEQLADRIKKVLAISSENTITQGWLTSVAQKGSLWNGSIYVDPDDPKDIATFGVKGRDISMSTRADTSQIANQLKTAIQTVISAAVASEDTVEGIVDIRSECERYATISKFLPDEILEKIFNKIHKEHIGYSRVWRDREHGLQIKFSNLGRASEYDGQSWISDSMINVEVFTDVTLSVEERIKERAEVLEMLKREFKDMEDVGNKGVRFRHNNFYIDIFLSTRTSDTLIDLMIYRTSQNLDHASPLPIGSRMELNIDDYKKMRDLATRIASGIRKSIDPRELSFVETESHSIAR